MHLPATGIWLYAMLRGGDKMSKRTECAAKQGRIGINISARPFVAAQFVRPAFNVGYAYIAHIFRCKFANSPHSMCPKLLCYALFSWKSSHTLGVAPAAGLHLNGWQSASTVHAGGRQTSLPGVEEGVHAIV
jgi:hypothetical protein